MVKSAVCSVAVNHFIHQIELRTLKAPSPQTQTPLWNNLGLQTRVKYSQMIHKKQRVSKLDLFSSCLSSRRVKSKPGHGAHVSSL